MSLFIAADWAGDPGFRRGATPRCAMAVVSYASAVEIDAALEDVRRARRLRPGFEFKYGDTLESVALAFAERIAQTSVAAVVTVYDKAALDPPWAWGKDDDLLAALMARAILLLPRESVEGARVFVDGDAEAKKLARMVRPLLSRQMVAWGLDYRIGKITKGESSKNAGIQVADMIGGSAVAAVERRTTDTPMLRRLHGKVTIDVIAQETEKPTK